MPSFFVNRSLSRGDLTLFLRNGADRPQDGYDVRWTVYRKDGIAASGLRIPATRAGTGEYYAPWGCARVGGCYYVKWDYSDSPGGVRQTISQDFFVLDGSGCCAPCASPVSAADATACGAYYSGQVLGPGDLCFQVLDDDGLPAQAFLVFWTIFDRCGNVLHPRTQAAPGQFLGEYYAPWIVSGIGNVLIKWEWMTDADSPFQAECRDFFAVSPPALFSMCEGELSNFRSRCPPSPPPQVIVVGFCDDPVIPRTVVLGRTVLPPGGAFTHQTPFAVPSGIRRVSFYVSYTRVVSGGFPVVRLMWGNGVEETQSSIINSVFASFNSTFATNQVRLNDLIGPSPESDDPISFMLESTVPGGSSTVRLLIAEGGQIGLPGTAEISLTGS